MFDKLKILQNLKKFEICALVIAWFYLSLSIIVVIVGSILYALLMLDYWRVRSEPFPGMMILMCAISISFAIMIIWISFDMLYGIKNKNHKEIWKFRFFSLLCLIVSFIILSISLFKLRVIAEWIFKENYEAMQIPTIDILLSIFVYHMVIYILIDIVYDDYKRRQQKNNNKKEDVNVSVSNLSESVDNNMLHIVEIH